MKKRRRLEPSAPALALSAPLVDAGDTTYFDRLALADASCRRGDCVMLTDSCIVQILQAWRCEGTEYVEVRRLRRRHELNFDGGDCELFETDEVIETEVAHVSQRVRVVTVREFLALDATETGDASDVGPFFVRYFLSAGKLAPVHQGGGLITWELYSRRRRQVAGLSSRAEVGDIADSEQSPLARASARLRLSAVPSRLPCREEERKHILEFVDRAVRAGGLGAAMYISGMPGTGKTATVHEVIATLQQDKALPTFRFVEINGMRLPEPIHVYSRLWEAVSRERVAPKRAAQCLENHFSNASAVECVVVLADELDHMLTPKQEVLYNLFEWPTRKNSRLVVIGVANTMDLPERLGPKMQSRLGYDRFVFASYQRAQVEKIVRERLGELEREIFEPGAVEMAARKVAAASGDVRRALQICSRACDRCHVLCDEMRARGEAPSAVVTVSDISRAARELDESAQIQAMQRATSCEMLVMIGIGAELRSGKSLASLADVHDRIASITAAHTVADEVPALSHAELLEVASTLGEACLVHVSGATSDGGRGPMLELLVPVSILARSAPSGLGAWLPRS